jgi:hypothetical protein
MEVGVAGGVVTVAMEVTAVGVAGGVATVAMAATAAGEATALMAATTMVAAPMAVLMK